MTKKEIENILNLLESDQVGKLKNELLVELQNKGRSTSSVQFEKRIIKYVKNATKGVLRSSAVFMLDDFLVCTNGKSLIALPRSVYGDLTSIGNSVMVSLEGPIKSMEKFNMYKPHEDDSVHTYINPTEQLLKFKLAEKQNKREQRTVENGGVLQFQNGDYIVDIDTKFYAELDSIVDFNNGKIIPTHNTVGPRLYFEGDNGVIVVLMGLATSGYAEEGKE